MTGKQRKQIVARFFEDAINQRGLGACDRLLSDGFVHNGETRGRSGA